MERFQYTTKPNKCLVIQKGVFRMRHIRNKISRTIFSVLLAISIIPSVSAVPILSFNNAQAFVSESAEIGDIVTFELWFSGLDTDDVGGFDFTMSFNNAVSSLNDLVVNPDVTEFDIFDITILPESTSFYGVSFAFDLSQQADEFMLASFQFLATSAGISDLVLDPVLISDSFGIELDMSLFDAQLVVNEPTNVEVPTPTSWGIYLMGLIGLGLRLRQAKI
jgi:hypothetical protein